MKRILAIGCASIAFLVAATSWVVIRVDESNVAARQAQALEAVSNDLESKFFLRHQAELQWVAHQLSIQEFLLRGGWASGSILGNLEQVRGLLDLEVVYLISAQGVIVASTDPTSRGIDLSARESFREGMSGLSVFSLTFDPGKGPRGLYASTPVLVRGRIVGLVAFQTASLQLDQALAESSGVFLLDPSGKVFSSGFSSVPSAASWRWDGTRALVSGVWNRVSRRPLSIVPGFTLVSLKPETWPWGTLAALNMLVVLFAVIVLAIWHLSRLARERKAEQRSRHERELLLANLLEGIAVLDSHGRLVWANPAFHRLAQTDPLGAVATMADWWDPTGEGTWRDVLEGKKPWVVFEAVLRGLQNGWTPVLAGFTAAEGQFLLSVLDRSEHHRSDQLLRQSQKLTVLGQLSGGIAHDLNNMLGVLMGMADLIKLTLPDRDPLQESVDLMLQTLTRAAGLAEKMLDFARQTPMAQVPLDITALLRELRFLARTALPPLIEAQFEIPEGPIWVPGDENLLLSALLNLLINAGEALPGGGLVKVGGRSADSQFEMVVEDQGLGMDAPTLARIFEPFFSTKLEKKGTGLGLSLVRRTILEHHGSIEVKSAPGQGTQVRVTLPVIGGTSGLP